MAGAPDKWLAATLPLLLPATAAAQAPPPVPLELSAPRLVASGVRVPLEGNGAPPGSVVTIELQRRGSWRRLRRSRAGPRGRFRAVIRPRPGARRLLLRALAGDGRISPVVRVRSRAVTLAAVGDVNLGDGVAEVMGRRGPRYPWTGVARTLRSADIAFGNLECSVSRRGRPVPKEYRFRGRPGALRVVSRYAGFDVLNLANNHVGDYGTVALLDTVRYVRRFGMKAVGAGGSLASARRPRIVRRLGLRVAFVGFSDIGPAWFAAGARRPGTQFASLPGIRSGVRRARSRADVVVATFHWGDERSTRPNGRQRMFARTALRAGAHAVIGAHPHVLQPVVRRGRRLVAYSLGNFVWSAGSGPTSRTGILRLRLSARGVERARLLPARIESTRPRLL